MNFETPETPKTPKTPETPEINESKVVDFILKLAESEGLPEDEAISSIVNQLELLVNSRNLPDIISMLSPGEYHSQTKRLSEIGKQRLDKALDIFTTPRDI